MKKSVIILSVFALSLSTVFATNNCLTFDGTDDYVSFNTSPPYTDTFTIEAWIKTTSSTDAHDIVCWGNTGLSDNVQFRTSLGKLSFGSHPSGGTWVSCQSSVSVNTGKWTHVAVVKDGESVQLYVNGIADGSGTNPNSMNVNYMLIGKYVNDPFFFSGSMDEIRIWDDVRTETEIRQNMYQELSDPSSETNLIAYYKFDETSETTLADSKGSCNGSLENMSGSEWQTSPAMFGPKNALDFDGTDDYVGFDSSPLYSETISIEAWIKTTSTTDVNDIVCWGNLGQPDNVQFRTSYGKLSFGTHPYGGSWVSCQSSVDVNTGVWTHVAVVKNGESMQLYVNGIADGSGINSNSVSIHYMLIGKYVNDSYFFSGTMDEVRIWSTARTATQIRENMFKTLTGNESGLVAYYNFDNTSGTILQDLSGNGSDGTLRDMDETTDWVQSAAFNTWLNTASSDWSTATNWSYGSVPTLSDNVGIYGWSGGNEADISGSVNNMIISSTSSPTLSSGIIVNGNLILEKNMGLNGQTITLGSSATLVEDEGAFSGTSGSITTTRNLSNINENVAGLGATITEDGDLGSTTITRSHAAPGSAAIKRVYRITPTNSPSAATLVFHYDDSELNGQTENTLKLFKSADGESWVEQVASVVNTTDNTLTLTGINAFSYWTAAPTGSESALPIELASFTATVKNGTVELAWETASETNNASFIIYRNDEAIGSVAGAGTTSKPHGYCYVDNMVVPDITYTYVLADVDYANKENRYESQAVTLTVSDNFIGADFVIGNAYPNPFNPATIVPFNLSRAALVKASLYGLNGREVRTLINETFPAGTHHLHIDGANMITGLYVLQIIVEDHINTQKIVLMK